MRILIAEDEPVSRRLLEAKLLKWGYDVIVTCDGDEAWEALRAEDAPRLAILDWMMPGVDGVEICGRMRREAREPYTYIILLTALHSDEDLVTGMEAGADDYITKPFKANELKVRLRAGKRIIDLQNDLIEAREALLNEAAELKQTTEDLNKAYTKLKATQAQMLQTEKMASIGQLAAGVAHEINNPIGFITCNLGTLGKYTERLTEYIHAQTEILKSLERFEELEELGKQIKLDYIIKDMPQLVEESLEGAVRVMKIVQNLKSFSRLDEAEWQLANINDCLESTLNIVWNELKYKAEVKKEYGLLPDVKCNPGQLNQVFMNLLVNAANSIEKQGDIGVRTWCDDRDLYIAVSDTGCGIPEEIRERIFDPFFTTKEIGKGTGLGLSISYDIIKKHGGEITVESEVGKGSLFRVRLPLKVDEEMV
jgi:two-component system NtrC family sensor kinase